MVLKGPSRPRQDSSPTVCTGTVSLPGYLLLTEAISQWYIHLPKDVSQKNLKIYRTLSFGANRVTVN